MIFTGKNYKANYDLFVYNWFYNGYAVYGHCLNQEGKYVLLKITDFYPSCYVEGSNVPHCDVTPYKVEYKNMVTSQNVSSVHPFCRVFFYNLKDMNNFTSKVRGCYMTDIPQISAFLSQVNADHVGWIQVVNMAKTANHDDTSFIITNMSNITKKNVSNKLPFSDPKIMAFDIEVKSCNTGMPKPHKIADTVEMISVVVFSKNQCTKYIMHTYRKPFGISDATDIICENEINLITRFF